MYARQQGDHHAADVRAVRAERHPEVSLTGQQTERVDTRVMQIIYSFHSGDPTIKPGQQMDVYLDAQSVAAISAELAKPLQ